MVGIVRGGLVPARLVATYLGVKDVHCLTVKKQGSERKVITEINEDLTDKHILLVEDILETGRGLITAKDYLESKRAIVETACLYILPQSETEPDYYLKKIKKIYKFPWE